MCQILWMRMTTHKLTHINNIDKAIAISEFHSQGATYFADVTVIEFMFFHDLLLSHGHESVRVHFSMNYYIVCFQTSFQGSISLERIGYFHVCGKQTNSQRKCKDNDYRSTESNALRLITSG